MDKLTDQLMQLKVKFLDHFRDKNDLAHALISENIALVLMLVNPLKIWWSVLITYAIVLGICLFNEYKVDKGVDHKDISRTMLYAVVGIVIGTLFRLIW